MCLYLSSPRGERHAGLCHTAGAGDPQQSLSTLQVIVQLHARHLFGTIRAYLHTRACLTGLRKGNLHA